MRFITFILLLCRPGRGEMSVEDFPGVNVTKKELSMTAADKSCHCYGLLSTYALDTWYVCELYWKGCPRLHMWGLKK